MWTGIPQAAAPGLPDLAPAYSPAGTLAGKASDRDLGATNARTAGPESYGKAQVEHAKRAFRTECGALAGAHRTSRERHSRRHRSASTIPARGSATRRRHGVRRGRPHAAAPSSPAAAPTASRQTRPSSGHTTHERQLGPAAQPMTTGRAADKSWDELRP